MCGSADSTYVSSAAWYMIVIVLTSMTGVSSETVALPHLLVSTPEVMEGRTLQPSL